MYLNSQRLDAIFSSVLRLKLEEVFLSIIYIPLFHNDVTLDLFTTRHVVSSVSPDDNSSVRSSFSFFFRFLTGVNKAQLTGDIFGFNCGFI